MVCKSSRVSINCCCNLGPGIPHNSRAREVLFVTKTLQAKTTAYPSIGQKKLNGAASRMMLGFAVQLADQAVKDRGLNIDRLGFPQSLKLLFEIPSEMIVIASGTLVWYPLQVDGLCLQSPSSVFFGMCLPWAWCLVIRLSLSLNLNCGFKNPAPTTYGSYYTYTSVDIYVCIFPLYNPSHRSVYYKCLNSYHQIFPSTVCVTPKNGIG